VPGAHINGDLTMGETIADVGGVNVALGAYHRSLKGNPAPVVETFIGDQCVLLGWVRAWRAMAREDVIRKQIFSDPHSPRAFLVIGPTRNVNELVRRIRCEAGRELLSPARSSRAHLVR
jgi:putative endopeptidase